MATTVCQCGGLIQDRVCNRCGPRTRKREKTAARGYGGRWQRTSKAFLKRYPLCKDCQHAGIVTQATEVHHVRKIRDRPDLRYTWANLMALCTRCHAIRTARGE